MMQLGRVHSPLDSRTLRHAKYRKLAAAGIPQFPTQEDWAAAVPGWPMYKNNELGICGPAGAGHQLQSWTAYGQGKCITVSDAAVVKVYQDVGGYIFGDPSTDQGVNLLDLLKYLQQVGIDGHKIGPFVALDPTRQDELCEGHHLYTGVMLGLDMPVMWQNADVWDVGPNTLGDWGTGTWGGHCVVGEKYFCQVADVSAAGLWVITWGGLKLITWAALAVYCSEAYGILSQDFIKDGKSPIGLDYVTLLADLALVQAMPKASAVAYKAVPIPPFSKMVDTVLRITSANAAAFKAAGYTVVGRYLGGATPQEVLDITGAGMGILWFNYSRKNGWIPAPALGTVDAARDLGQAKSLSVPQNATIMFDCEGCGASPVGHLVNWAKPIAGAGILAGCYANGQDKMTGLELGAIPNLSRYMCGASVGTPEPLWRGWSCFQLRPTNTKVAGVQVDVSIFQNDSDLCTPTMQVRA